jgi:DHA2 family methylenomycin A resistance protein-like MFS transporter
VDAYAIVLAAMLLAGGAVGDKFGQRRVLASGLVLFTAASLLCATAPGSGLLIAGRAIQGVGAALLLPSTLAVVNRVFPGRAEQARALGIWAGVSALALPAGPLLGGLLVQQVDWRAVFWLNLPITLVVLPTAWRLVPPDPRSAGQRRLDPLGTALAGLALTALAYGAIAAGQGVSTRVWISGACCVLLFAGFLVWERFSREPVLPLLRTPAFTGANAIAATMNFVGIGTVFVATLYLQSFLHNGALTAGMLMLPLFVPLALGAPITGRLTARFGPRPPMLGGLLVGACGGVLLLAVRPDSGYRQLLPTLLCLGVGMGLLTAAVVTAALRAGPADRPGLSSGVNNAARQAGGALGTAVFGAMAGQPQNPAVFAAGIRQIGTVIAVLWAAAAVATWFVIPRREADRG